MTPSPYGSWPSPLSAEDLAVAGVRLGGPRYDGGDLYWTQARPAEGGRTALLRERDGMVTEVAPGLNVRTRVHEYGGGAWDARGGVVVVSSDPKAASPRTHTCWSSPTSAAVSFKARLRCQSAALPERVGPFRRAHSVTSGALDGVEIVTSSAFNPRTRV